MPSAAPATTVIDSALFRDAFGTPAMREVFSDHALVGRYIEVEIALAICHLGDRILGGGPFIQPFPGSERILTLAEVQELQTRLTKAGFDTGGTDGRVGNDTMKAVRDYQLKMGIDPADGYGGLKVLARLRQGS